MTTELRAIGSKAWWDGSYNGNRTPVSHLEGEVEITGYSEYKVFFPEGQSFRYKVKAEGVMSSEFTLYEFELQDSKPVVDEPVGDAPQVEE
jgi:hypothetical protein